MVNSINLIINEKTPSVNHLYGHNRFGSTYLKTEAKKLRERIIQTINEQLIKQNFVIQDWSEKLLDIVVIIYDDWWTKSKKINNPKRSDIANREKFLVDSVFEGLGLDDSYIWKHTMLKQDSDIHKSIIKISSYNNNLYKH